MRHARGLGQLALGLARGLTHLPQPRTHVEILHF